MAFVGSPGPREHPEPVMEPIGDVGWCHGADARRGQALAEGSSSSRSRPRTSDRPSDRRAGRDPIFFGRNGERLDRHAAWRIVRRLARKAGIDKPVGPHTLRHADPRTTMRYDRAPVSLDRHATYVVAAFLAGAAR